MKKRYAFIAILAALLMQACNSRFTVRLEGAEAGRPSGKFLAGASRVDITPLPGVPLGGFGEAAKVSRGTWMPLYARAVYFEDPDGNQMAMVICDLWSMPSGLANRVADIVQDDPSCSTLDRREIIVAATHTHSSPAHFSSHVFYNSHSSNDEGFDFEFFEFLSHRIAGAIIMARRSATESELRMNRVLVSGVARNRSLGAFLRNHDCDAMLSGNSQVPPIFPPVPLAFPIDTSSYRAVDPYLTILRADSAGRPGAPPIAVVAFFPVHNTAMGASTEVYTGDVFGVATRMTEQALQGSAAQPPVVALFNSAEGDISPNWYRQDRLNTVRIGSTLAKSLHDGATAATERTDGPIALQYDVVSLRSRRVKNNVGDLTYFAANENNEDAVQHWTDDRATVGVATLGGGEDGWTTFHDQGYVEGVNSRRLSGRGSKETELTLGTVSRPVNKLLNIQATITTRGIPDEAPLGVYRIGKLVIGTLPGEVTTMLGHRIADRLKRATSSQNTVALVGLANEYISYFTTPEEFDAQEYEGATTLYGPASGPLLEVELERLARGLGKPDIGTWMKLYRYEPGHQHTFTMQHVGASPWTITEGVANIVQNPATGRPKHDFPQVTWLDSFWGLPRLENLTEMNYGVNPLVMIEIKMNNAWRPLNVVPRLLPGTTKNIREDNTGLNFVTLCLGASDAYSKWGAIWMYPEGIDPAAELRFNARLSSGATFCSQSFTLGTYATTFAGPVIPMAGDCN